MPGLRPRTWGGGGEIDVHRMRLSVECGGHAAPSRRVAHELRRPGRRWGCRPGTGGVRSHGDRSCALDKRRPPARNAAPSGAANTERSPFWTSSN